MKFRGVCLAVSIAFAAASASCADHSCEAVGVLCEQTLLTIKSQGNLWAAGMYTLALSVDGLAKQCILQVPDSAAARRIQGTCSADDTTFTFLPICPPVCDNMVCRQGPATCLPGQFEMSVVVSPAQGPDAQAHVASQVGLDLALNGNSLLAGTITPAATTTEPNGVGCGMCTNASATVPVSSG